MEVVRYAFKACYYGFDCAKDIAKGRRFLV